MMKIVSLLAFVGSANAFTPVQSQQRSTAMSASSFDPAEMEKLIGVDLESGNKVFDPVGLAQWAPADFLREAELANGRVAMLATVGWWAPKLYGTWDAKDITTTDPLKAIFEADPQWWAQFILLCGSFEFYKYQGVLAGKSYLGEGPPVVDYLNQWETYDENQKADIRLKELKNARLAMLGIASFLADYFIPGSVPFLSGLN